MKKVAILSLALAFAFALSVTPALANHDTTFVYNDNNAVVVNDVEANASTGGNTAGGSTGGDGGDGGNVSIVNEDDPTDTFAGDGGDGGDGSIGGTVVTGDATATALAANDVNSNNLDFAIVNVDQEDPPFIDNQNNAVVANGLMADADTGMNRARGSVGGDGGNGGHVDIESEEVVDDTSGGDGGNGGMGGEGGFIQTGEAVSEAGAVNVINRNVTRIRL